jgi:hypothetical protein
VGEKGSVKILVVVKYIRYRYWSVTPVQMSMWLGLDAVSHAPPQYSPAVA